MHEDHEERRRNRGQYAFIPAGVLIGLGIGLLAGYAGSGVLIGLGSGFLATGCMRLIRRGKGPDDAQGKGVGKTMVLIPLGIILILIGAGILFAPVSVWPYLIAGFLILLGIGFLFHGFFHTR